MVCRMINIVWAFATVLVALAAYLFGRWKEEQTWLSQEKTLVDKQEKGSIIWRQRRGKENDGQ